MDERFTKARALARAVRASVWSGVRGFRSDPNVVGTAFGRRIVNGLVTGEPAIVVYVNRKLDKGRVPLSQRIPRRVFLGGDFIEVDVVETGPIYPFEFTARERPAPSGISVGHIAISAGTLGALVRDNTDGSLCILSNNHVLANENGGSLGDPIVQPGPSDGGTDPADTIARLKRFVPLSTAGTNRVDAAIAEVINAGDVVDQMKNNLMPVPGPGHPAVGLLFAGGDTRVFLNPIDEVLAALNCQFLAGGGSTAAAELDMAVEKVGRTTEYTTATVMELDAAPSISYDIGTVSFTGAIATAGQLGCPGDSGSVVCRGGAGGTGNSTCPTGGCVMTAALEDVFGLPLDLDAAAEKEFRERYLGQTLTGRYLLDVFFRNENTVVGRIRAAKLSEPDRRFAREMYDRHAAGLRSAMLQPARADWRLSKDTLQDLHEGAGRAMKHMSEEERKATTRLLRIADQAQGKNMSEILEMLNNRSVHDEVVQALSAVPSLSAGGPASGA